MGYRHGQPELFLVFVDSGRVRSGCFQVEPRVLPRYVQYTLAEILEFAG